MTQKQIILTPSMFATGSLVTSVDEKGFTHHLYKTSDESKLLHLITMCNKERVQHLTIKSLDSTSLMHLIGTTAAITELCNPQALAIFSGVFGVNLEESGIAMPRLPCGTVVRAPMHTDFKRKPLSMDVVEVAVERLVGKTFNAVFGLLDPVKAEILRKCIVSDLDGNSRLKYEFACKLASNELFERHPLAKIIMDSTLHAASRIRTEFSKDLVNGDNDGVYELCMDDIPSICSNLNKNAQELHQALTGRISNIIIRQLAVGCAVSDIQDTAFHLLQQRDAFMNESVGVAA